MRLILYILIAVGGTLVALALSMVFVDGDVAQVEPQSPSIELAKEAPIKLIQPDLNASPPLNVDVARIKPDGAAVFAGTASPNATIRIFEGNVILGKTIADSLGEWVIVLEKSLAAGQHLVSIAMEKEDGSTELSNRSLAVEIYKDAITKPLVALLPETATEVPVLIQSPDDLAATISGTIAEATPNIIATEQQKVAKAGSTTSVVSVVDPTLFVQEIPKSGPATIFPTSIIWRDASNILISGISRGGGRVIATDLKGPFGEALVLADGAWQIGGKFDLEVLQYNLKFTLLDNMNIVIATYNLPIKSRDLAKGKDGSPLIVVNKGDALWRIAYRRFGDGVRYIDIVRRNQKDIMNPDLIYPKQIFVVPKSATDMTKQN